MSWRGDELIGEAPVAAQQVIGRAKADEIITTRQSIDVLPPAMFPGWHTIGRIESEAWDGELEVCKLSWEQTGEETRISSIPMAQMLPAKAELKLDYNGTIDTVDGENIRCTIGRGHTATLRVNGNFTSQQHAEITYRNGRFNLRDESVNGIVTVDDDGNVKKLRREEDVLSGSGMIGFGASPREDPDGAVRYDCT